MSEHLDERLRTAARTYRRLGNQSAESMFLEAADTICKIQEENEKLKKLCADMWDVALHPQLFGDGSYLLRRILDLGIEVDE